MVSPQIEKSYQWHLSSIVILETTLGVVFATDVAEVRLPLTDGIAYLAPQAAMNILSVADDVALDFDWAAGRITGTAKGEPVDVPIEPNVQDPVSIQIATMVALMDGRQPGEIPLIEGPQAKLYAYTFERAESLETDGGTFDTLVYRSARAGSDRETLLWLAPSLGYLAVRVEQHRKGRRLFGMFLKKYVSGG